MMLATVAPPISAEPAVAQPKLKMVFQKVEYKLASGQSVQSYAMEIYQWRGGTDKQWVCLKKLWTRESHWNYQARNPKGGAYGIPQAWPAHKLAKYGSDWRHNPAVQIMWGLDYIKYRYDNNACLALRHSMKRGFY